MKKLLLNLKDGNIFLEDTPIPSIESDEILIRTTKSLISSGTERMLINFGKQNYINKARSQPEKVKMVLDKIKNDGLIPTYRAVTNKLNTPMSIGYCNVGEVVSIGSDIKNFKVGDKVVSNTPHAEYVVSKENLTCKVDDHVDDEDAVFVILASISLQAIRNAQTEIGENFCVIGAGLVGIICTKIIESAGCNVVILDNDIERVRFSSKLGLKSFLIEENIERSIKSQYPCGADGVIIAASTEGNQPVELATKLSRNKGRIVSVGKTAINISYNNFFSKELTFKVSRSYGPGRYDYRYENKNYDYPFDYVRWTENRNFQSIINLLKNKKISFKNLISENYKIDDFKDAYENILSNKKSLAVLFNYENKRKEISKNNFIKKNNEKLKFESNNLNTCFIGAGSYASKFLIPNFKKNGFFLNEVISKTGVSGNVCKRKFGFRYSNTFSEDIFASDSEIMVISTQHNTHYNYVYKSIESGKHIFVEKPLALNKEEIDNLEKLLEKNLTYVNGEKKLLIGFNRRFAPQVVKLKSIIDKDKTKAHFIYTINAGFIPDDHWSVDKDIGGGRLIGEACHFIDLLLFLSGSEILNIKKIDHDKKKEAFSIFINFKNYSTGVIHYITNGSKAYPKENLLTFINDGIIEIKNFKSMSAFGVPGFKSMNLWNQDKGVSEMIKKFKNSLHTKENLIPLNQIIEVTRRCIELKGE